MDVDGIIGETTVRGYEGSTEIQAISFGFKRNNADDLKTDPITYHYKDT